LTQQTGVASASRAKTSNLFGRKTPKGMRPL
jgi:hypothetical protein